MSLTLPGPKLNQRLGFYGNLLEFYGDQIAYLQNCYRQYGKISGITANNHEIIFLFGAEYNKEILLNSEIFSLESTEKQSKDNALFRLTSGNIFNLSGEKHKVQRQFLLQGVQKPFFPIFQQQTAKVTEQFVKELNEDNIVDLLKICKDLIFRIDAKTLLGLDADKSSGDHFLAELFKNFIDHYEELANPNQENSHREKNYSQVLRLAEQLEFKLEIMVRNKKKVKKADFISFLFQSTAKDEKISEKDLICHLYAIFTASHDTTASALFWTLLMILLHPLVFQKLLDEFSTATNGDFFTFSQSKYLEQVIKESLRIFPPSALLSRIAGKDYQLGNYLIPRGSSIFISQYITHHLPEYFAQPERFLPERWDTISPSPFEYFPFGAGAHLCLGTGLAMLKLKTIIPILLTGKSFSLLPEMEINRQIKVTLNPKDPVPVKISAFSSAPPITPQVRGNIREMVDLNFYPVT